MLITDLGWDAYFQASWNETERGEGVPARVVAQYRGLWRIAGNFDECWAEPSGRLRLQGEGGGDWPAVGDWTAAEIRAGQGNAILHDVLPRRSRFSRKAAGRAVIQQVVAANIDVALIVAGLDGDFNLRRIERYMAQCWESSVRPVIVLNKADACEGPREYAAMIERTCMGTPTFVVSARTGDGIEELEASLVKGWTAVLLGSSGVGKSTLVNRLLREERQATQPVRRTDSKGRHTTTRRELFVLPSGAIMIDTPGLRELQLWSECGDLAQTFVDVEELATRCRFRDCRHESEPGCAVKAAVKDGTIDGARLENKRKLQREQEFLLRKLDPERQHEYKKRIKILFRAIRQDAQSRSKEKN
ncbi:MAG TPA: ribosome small subunit-dependent GTPase A [Candidatus Methylomirabilis sp.]|nr:ribosome small subunit-dependent GTPase A [Candidatus Methylomirabilis sp.]